MSAQRNIYNITSQSCPHVLREGSQIFVVDRNDRNITIIKPHMH